MRVRKGNGDGSIGGRRSGSGSSDHRENVERVCRRGGRAVAPGAWRKRTMEKGRERIERGFREAWTRTGFDPRRPRVDKWTNRRGRIAIHPRARRAPGSVSFLHPSIHPSIRGILPFDVGDVLPFLGSVVLPFLRARLVAVDVPFPACPPATSERGLPTGPSVDLDGRSPSLPRSSPPFRSLSFLRPRLHPGGPLPPLGSTHPTQGGPPPASRGGSPSREDAIPRRWRDSHVGGGPRSRVEGSVSTSTVRVHQTLRVSITCTKRRGNVRHGRARAQSQAARWVEKDERE